MPAAPAERGAAEPGGVSSEQIARLPIGSIHPNPRNPRTTLTDVGSLAASIQEYGLLQPLVVRPTEHGYELVAGHRRFAAVKSLNWSEVPAILRDADDEQSFLLALIENLQRDDLSSHEESRALELLVRERGWTTRQVAEAIKRSQAYVSKRLRVFEDECLAPLVLQNKLKVSVAEELLPLPASRRRSMAERAAREAWDGPTARAAVGRLDPAKHKSARAKTGASLLRQLRTLRAILKSTRLQDLPEPQRRELRLLFLDLAVFAKAAPSQREMVIPALPLVSARDGKAG